VFEEIDGREPLSRSTPERDGVLAAAGDFQPPAELTFDCNGQNMLSRRYLVPTGLPAPESADLSIVDEDLVATEPVTPPGGNAMDDDESHVRIIRLREPVHVLMLPDR
jgi:hypothetical protein